MVQNGVLATWEVDRKPPRGLIAIDSNVTASKTLRRQLKESEMARIELSRPMPGPDGKPPAFYRLTEIWFKNAAAMKAVTGRPEWKKIADDVPNFATGGATILVSTLE